MTAPRPDSDLQTRSLLRDVTTAALEFLKDVDRICGSSEYASVFHIAAMHGCPYSGPTWEKSREALRATLAKVRI